jgi:hypothetical protein
MSLILSRRDLDFLLFEWLDVESLLSRPRCSEHDRQTVGASLDLAQTLAETLFAPHNRLVDRDEPRMRADDGVDMPVEIGAALAALLESGLLGASHL